MAINQLRIWKWRDESAEFVEFIGKMADVG